MNVVPDVAIAVKAALARHPRLNVDIRQLAEDARAGHADGDSSPFADGVHDWQDVGCGRQIARQLLVVLQSLRLPAQQHHARV
jgi:hypothetical protein